MLPPVLAVGGALDRIIRPFQVSEFGSQNDEMAINVMLHVSICGDGLGICVDFVLCTCKLVLRISIASQATVRLVDFR